jgi:hypothetical protein
LEISRIFPRFLPILQDFLRFVQKICKFSMLFGNKLKKNILKAGHKKGWWWSEEIMALWPAAGHKIRS